MNFEKQNTSPEKQNTNCEKRKRRYSVILEETIEQNNEGKSELILKDTYTGDKYWTIKSNLFLKKNNTVVLDDTENKSEDENLAMKA